MNEEIVMDIEECECCGDEVSLDFRVVTQNNENIPYCEKCYSYIEWEISNKSARD